jgi:hypothetical protein
MKIEAFRIEYYGCQISNKISLQREDIPTCIRYKYALVVHEQPCPLWEKMNYNLYTITTQTKNFEIIKFICTIDTITKTIEIHYATHTTENEKAEFLLS